VSFGLIDLARHAGCFDRVNPGWRSAQLLGRVRKLLPVWLLWRDRTPLHLLVDLTSFCDQIFLAHQTSVQTCNRSIRPLCFSGGATRQPEVEDGHNSDQSEQDG
jgi:hypothetical protein